MKIKRILLTTLATLGITLGLTGCGEKSVNIMDNITVEFSGIDGKGTAVAHFDDTVLAEALGYDEDIENLEDLGKAIVAEEALLNSYEYKLDKTEGFSNGDKVKVTVKYNNEKAKKAKVKFVGEKEKEFEVTGLAEKIELDAFAPDIFNTGKEEGVVVEFSGTSPNADIQIRNLLSDDNPLSKATYTCDRYGDIKKGDSVEIKVTLPYDYEEQGYVLKEESTTITCDKVAEYIISLDDIDKKTWDKIKTQYNDIKKAKIDTETEDGFYVNTDGYGRDSLHYSNTVSNFKYGKAYLITLKDGIEKEYDRYNNYLILSFTIDATKGTSGWSPLNDNYKGICGYMYITDLIKDKDGNVNFSIDMLKIGECYISEDTFVNKEITPTLDQYTMTEKDLNW